MPIVTKTLTAELIKEDCTVLESCVALPDESLVDVLSLSVLNYWVVELDVNFEMLKIKYEKQNQS